MSTKIYNGFRFRSPNMPTIWKWLGQFQKEVWNTTVDCLSRAYAKHAVFTFDSRTLGRPSSADKDLSISPAAFAYDCIAEPARSALKDIPWRDQHPLADKYNYKAQVGVYPIHNNLTLGFYFIDNRKLEKLFREQTWFIDYHYQNQTDRPENVTAKEWRKRRQDWDKAFTYSDRFCQAGFIMTLHDPAVLWHRPGPKLVMPFVPSYGERLRDFVKDAVLKDYEKRHPLDLNRIFTHHEKFEKYLKTKKGKAEWKKHEKRIRKKLKKSISQKDLFSETALKNFRNPKSGNGLEKK